MTFKQSTALTLLSTTFVGLAQTTKPTLNIDKTASILDISAHATAAFGTDKGQPIHGHDPSEEVTLQGIELGLNLRVNEYLEGFINTNLFLEDQKKFDGEWEEGFIKFKNLKALTGSFEVRGGRYLNRLGMQNNVHLHGWDFIDANLSTGLFLGEEGLKTEGFELSWLKEHGAGNFMISGSYGNAIEHMHGHGDEDEHGDEEEHEGEEEHEDEEEHDPAEETTELSYFNGNLFTVRAQYQYNANDFNYHKFGFNYAHGDNGFGRSTEFFSVDYLYKWRQNGLESGGKEWTAGLELATRSVEWVDEDNPAIQGDSSQQSAMFKASHTFRDNWSVGARYGWIEGVTDGSFVTNQRKRLSLALTHRYTLADSFTGHARLQYNHDDLNNGGSEDSVWLQLQFNFGKGEVR